MNLGVHKAMTSEQNQQSPQCCLVLSRADWGKPFGFNYGKTVCETKTPHIKGKGAEQSYHIIVWFTLVLSSSIYKCSRTGN